MGSTPISARAFDIFPSRMLRVIFWMISTLGDKFVRKAIGRVAQQGEHFACTEGVAGSMPVTSTTGIGAVW